MDNCHTVFAGDFNLDVSSNSNVIRNFVDRFHQYGHINNTNLPTCVSPITGVNTSSMNHLSHNLNCSRRSYVVSPALFEHYAKRVIFRINHDSPPQSI